MCLLVTNFMHLYNEKDQMEGKEVQNCTIWQEKAPGNSMFQTRTMMKDKEDKDRPNLH